MADLEDTGGGSDDAAGAIDRWSMFPSIDCGLRQLGAPLRPRCGGDIDIFTMTPRVVDGGLNRAHEESASAR